VIVARQRSCVIAMMVPAIIISALGLFGLAAVLYGEAA
jgi:hypothetical protein